MTQTTRLLMMALGLAVVAPLFAAEVRADSGNIYTLGQDGRLLNRVATWERSNGQARIVVLGSPIILNVNMTQPLSTSGGVNVFRYSATDTRYQPSNSGAWTVVAVGEIAMDTRTMRGNGVDGFWRRTARIMEANGSSQMIPDAAPPQRIRFVVE